MNKKGETLKNEYPTLRIFVGVSGIDTLSCKGTVSVMLCADYKSYITLPYKRISLNHTDDYEHKLKLSALKYGLEAVKKNYSDFVNVIYYPNYDLISFEWNKEYLEDNCFSSQTNDKSIWNKIIQLVKDSKINLSIKGSESVLGALSSKDGEYHG